MIFFGLVYLYLEVSEKSNVRFSSWILDSIPADTLPMTSYLKIKLHNSIFSNFHLIAFGGGRYSTHFGIKVYLNHLIEKLWKFWFYFDRQRVSHFWTKKIIYSLISPKVPDMLRRNVVSKNFRRYWAPVKHKIVNQTFILPKSL